MVEVMKNFYKELPVGYKEIKVIDAKDKKTIIIMYSLSIVLFLAAILPFFLLKPINISIENSTDIIGPMVLMIGGMFGYIILHELVHGFWYKILTKEKLTFGITLTVAFCGVPNIYVNKKTALLAITGPFLLFSLILIPILIIIPANLTYFVLVMIFGCSGDLYGTFYMLTQNNTLLMNDTGPKQTFYDIDNDMK